MNKRELGKFKKLLLAEGQHFNEGIKTIERDTLESTNGDKSGDFSSFADAGTDNNDRETALRLASGETQMLNAVADALQRIDDGTYGKCVDCDGKIPVKRLEVFPAAKRCIQCKEILEKEQEGYA
ncbi:MAG: TraR/DksA family transcriptional regulator [Candidatus Hydrogenedentota bacterium]